MKFAFKMMSFYIFKMMNLTKLTCTPMSSSRPWTYDVTFFFFQMRSHDGLVQNPSFFNNIHHLSIEINLTSTRETTPDVTEMVSPPIGYPVRLY